MNRIPKIASLALVMAVVMMAVILFTTTYHKAKSVSADRALQVIYRDISASKWSKDVLLKYATPELQARMFNHTIEPALALFRAEGRIEKFEGVEEFQYEYTNGIKTAAITQKIRFAKGSRLVTTHMEMVGKNWRLVSFQLHTTQPVLKGASQ